MTFMPMVFGTINEPRSIQAYDNSLKLLLILGSCGLIASLALVLEDRRTGNILFLPENHENVLKKKKLLGQEMAKILEEEQAVDKLGNT